MNTGKTSLAISPRCTLVTLEFVRSLRGCDAAQSLAAFLERRLQ